MGTSFTTTVKAGWNQLQANMPPTVIALGFLLAIVSLRAFDLLVLRVDSWPDPTIVSKALGLLLVLWYLRSLQYHVYGLGLHTRNAAYAVAVGGLSLLLIFASLYAIEFYVLRVDGETPRAVLGIVDQRTGAVVAGSMFLSVYFAGQILNALTEECIFRGILLPQFMRRVSFWKANLAQASLFAVAHLVWPMSSWALGRATVPEALSEAGLLLVFTAVGGLIFGYLYYRTNNLWTPLLAHLIDNSVWLFVHIETSTRLNAETDVAIFGRGGFLSLVLIAWFVAKPSRIRPLKAWGTEDTSEHFAPANGGSG
jgi:membrane protease YdiL (CAAX protease family)